MRIAATSRPGPGGVPSASSRAGRSSSRSGRRPPRWRPRSPKGRCRTGSGGMSSSGPTASSLRLQPSRTAAARHRAAAIDGLKGGDAAIRRATEVGKATKDFGRRTPFKRAATIGTGAGLGGYRRKRPARSWATLKDSRRPRRRSPIASRGLRGGLVGVELCRDRSHLFHPRGEGGLAERRILGVEELIDPRGTIDRDLVALPGQGVSAGLEPVAALSRRMCRPSRPDTRRTSDGCGSLRPSRTSSAGLSLPMALRCHARMALRFP